MCSLEIDAFFRPAAVTLAQLTAFLLLRDAGFDLRARLGALFGVGTAAYMPCSGVSGGWEARQKAVRCRMAAPGAKRSLMALGAELALGPLDATHLQHDGLKPLTLLS